MKLATLAAIVSAATLVSALPAMAITASNSTGSGDSPHDMTGPGDSTGMSTLGVDISSAGGSSASVRQFLARLSPDTRNSVLTGCSNAIANHDGTFNPVVLSFCRTATGTDGVAYNQSYTYRPLRTEIAPSYPASLASTPDNGNLSGAPAAGTSNH